MLSASDNCDSINERTTQKVNKLIKLHILGCGKLLMNLLGNWLIRLQINTELEHTMVTIYFIFTLANDQHGDRFIYTHAFAILIGTVMCINCS